VKSHPRENTQTAFSITARPSDDCPGGDSESIYKELIANTVPNGHMVTAGVLAANRAQEYGYTFLTAL